MSSSEPLSIAIIGGGIGGLSLAIGLVQLPHLKVTVYEAAPVFAEIGAGVALGPNAQRALSLIASEAGDAFTRHATTSLSPAFAKVWFDFRCGMAGPRSGDVLGVIQNDTGQQTVHRARFLEELASLIPDGVARFGKRLVEVEDLGPERGVKMTFGDGTTATADGVIGADGIHSAVRQSLLGASHPAANPVFSGTVAYRALIPMDVARNALGEFADNSYMWCGEEGMVMTYPIDHGATLNVVASRNGKVAWDHPGKSFVPATQQQLLNDFANWGEMPLRILSLIEHPTLWAMLDHPPAPYFHSGNIVMMGDAAHATTPFQGAGAGQAIEDALIISTLFRHVKTIEKIAPAFAAYDAVRLPRSQKVVVTSRDALNLYCFNDGFANGDSAKWQKVWDGRMDWLWNFDLVKQNHEAVQRYKRSISEALWLASIRTVLVSGIILGIPACYLGSNKMAATLKQAARALLVVFQPLVPSSLLAAVF